MGGLFHLLRPTTAKARRAAGGPDTAIVPLECPVCRRPHWVHVDAIERIDRPKSNGE